MPVPPADAVCLADARARLVRLARALVRDPSLAEDAAHDALVVCLERPHEPRTSWHALLGGILRNVLRGRRRAERRRQARELGAAQREAQPSAADHAARVEQHVRLFQALHGLPEPSRRTLVLRHLEGLPPRRIAAQEGVSLACVKSRLRRGLALLRARLDAGRGGRSAWLGALLPFTGARLSDGGLLASLGGFMATTAIKRALGASIALLLAGGGALAVSGVLDQEPEAGHAASMSACAREGVNVPVGDGAQGPRLEGAAGAGPAAAVPVIVAETLAARAAPSAATVPADGPEALDASLPPAVRRSAFQFDPPTRSSGSARGAPVAPVRGGPPGGIGPSGYWSRLRPVVPSGEAALSVGVRLPDGRPVPGAEVYLAPPDTLGGPPLSFGDLLQVGVTGSDGRVRKEHVPEGRASLLVNLPGITNREAGLDPRYGQAIALKAGPQREALITLDSGVAELGRIDGQVLDPDGQAVARARVGLSRWFQAFTDAEGRFHVPFVPAGTIMLDVSASGYAPAAAVAEVPRGGAGSTTVRLALADGGRITLTGDVVGPDGEPVPGASVYVLETAARGTLRSALADAQGRFRITGLPDRLASAAWRLQADRIPDYNPASLDFPAGRGSGDVRITLGQRLVRTEVSVLDAVSGVPLRRATARLLNPASRLRREVPLRFDASLERYEGTAEAGPQDLVVETLDGPAQTLRVEVAPDAQGIWRADVRVPGALPEPVDVRLEVTLLDALSAVPVAHARVEVLASTSVVSRLEAGRREGVYVLPAPSGRRTLRVSAEGYEVLEQPLDLDVRVPEVALRLRLSPR